MTKRSRAFWLVAFFLSKYGEPAGQNKASPPAELETKKWKDAYRMFYDAVGEGREISVFEHSLKNARDEFDSHIESSPRIGWLNMHGKAHRLQDVAERILTRYADIPRSEVWLEIQPYTEKSVVNYENVFDDLSAIQESEAEKERISKTEGGKKLVISYRYERSPSLRESAFRIHGYDCGVCGFNYEKKYGIWGKQFAEVHHVRPLSENEGVRTVTDPEHDLIVLCANCHRMVHRKRGITLSVEELKNKIIQNYMI
jgi:5-methylcytosine-specific restriction protein A